MNGGAESLCPVTREAKVRLRVNTVKVPGALRCVAAT